jgi:hypothetical protein
MTEFQGSVTLASDSSQSQSDKLIQLFLADNDFLYDSDKICALTGAFMKGI